MFKKSGLAVILTGWFILVIGGFLNLSCVTPYYYDHGHRVWRDGHDDNWHRAHGDRWEEYHGDQGR
jgi:hypothetical protein